MRHLRIVSSDFVQFRDLKSEDEKQTDKKFR